jgi:hypothetical protein
MRRTGEAGDQDDVGASAGHRNRDPIGRRGGRYRCDGGEALGKLAIDTGMDQGQADECGDAELEAESHDIGPFL